MQLGGQRRSLTNTPAVDRDLVGKATWIVGCMDKIDLIAGCPLFFVYLSSSGRREALISLNLAAAAGVHSVLRSLARRASSISVSFAGDSAPASSIRSSRLRVVSQVQGVKPGRGNATRSTP